MDGDVVQAEPAIWNVPVLYRLVASVSFYPGVCGFRKRADAAIERLVEHVAAMPRQKINHRLLVHDKLGRAKQRKQSLDFRSPVEAAMISRDV